MSSITRLYYRYWPSHIFGELLSKRWAESLIPFFILVIVISALAQLIDNYLGAGSIANTAREFSEFGFIALGLAVVVIAGGIDLSIGSIFALANILLQIFLQTLNWPLPLAIGAVLVIGGALGAVNGFLIGYLKLRAFLTTLVTLIIFRSFVEILNLNYSVAVASGIYQSDAWDFFSFGNVFGLPFNTLVLIVCALLCHIALSRTRIGWHIQAIGGSRRAAYNAGINVKATLFSTYVFSGVMCAAAGVFYAARLSNTGGDVGTALEVNILTGIVLGGVSLGGGKGTIARALMGALIVFALTNGLVRLGVSGGGSSIAVGLLLIAAVGFDVKYQKNRHKLIDRVYVSPTLLELPPCPDTRPGAGQPWQFNDRLRAVEIIGLGQVEGPEDVIVDRNDNLYCGTRKGEVLRFSGPGFAKRELVARIGGRPLGLAFDRDDNLVTCVAGMGLYCITPGGEVRKLTDETNRSWRSINDDSRLRLADDLDIAPDGKMYFSEATTRYEIHNWPVDGLEGRGNGRIICYDSVNNTTRTLLRGLVFPNGVCVAHDAECVYFAETWACRVSRYWLQGPKAGKVEIVINDLPGYPDNINRASDGTYWLALVGMRTPAYDLAMRHPQFRKRLAKRLPPDEWLYPNINTGCILKFTADGTVLETMWDQGGENHPMISSIREHRGYLYIGGVSNNRIGRLKLDGADPNWVAHDAYWGRHHA
jgi:ribose transport system permease protein